MTHFHIYHDRDDTPNCLLAIFNDEARAKQWIEKFDPKMWMNKTMSKDNLKIVRK